MNPDELWNAERETHTEKKKKRENTGTHLTDEWDERNQWRRRGISLLIHSRLLFEQNVRVCDTAKDGDSEVTTQIVSLLSQNIRIIKKMCEKR